MHEGYGTHNDYLPVNPLREGILVGPFEKLFESHPRRWHRRDGRRGSLCLKLLRHR